MMTSDFYDAYSNYMPGYSLNAPLTLEEQNLAKQRNLHWVMLQLEFIIMAIRH